MGGRVESVDDELRYDQSRRGSLDKEDFQRMIADINGSYPLGSSLRNSIRPYTLTDSAGIPLGFTLTEKNSSFEAGQLFER